MPKTPADPVNAAAPDNPVAHFEQSLDELEQLVVKLEAGDMGLDDSLRAFERGILLYRTCQSALEQAEARVKLLLDPGDPESGQAFEVPEER